jgi:hypothetical protein
VCYEENKIQNNDFKMKISVRCSRGGPDKMRRAGMKNIQKVKRKQSLQSWRMREDALIGSRV